MPALCRQVLRGREDFNVGAYGLSFPANHSKGLHFTDFELSEFDVWTFVVVSDPSDPDIVKAKNLGGGNSPISGSRLEELPLLRHGHGKVRGKLAQHLRPGQFLQVDSL